MRIQCITQDLGYFDGGKPVAACVIYKCLLHWRSFEEVDRTTTSLFDRIIHAVASAIQVDDNNVSAYWLCNTSTLLLLLMMLQPTRSFSFSRRILQGSSSTSPQNPEVSCLNSQMPCRLDDLPQVKAQYPYLLFNQQLAASLEKTYILIRDNLKKDISPLLGQIVVAPRRLRQNLVIGGRRHPTVISQQDFNDLWRSIANILDGYLRIMKVNYVPPFFARKIFGQMFSFMNVQLFNSLILRRECCSFGNAEFLHSVLSMLKQWCISATDEYAGSSWDKLNHIRQAAGLVIVPQKHKKTLIEITDKLCPVLSIQQLHRISTIMNSDEENESNTFSTEVISSMRAMIKEDYSISGSRFILEDDLSTPFSVDDIVKSMPHMDAATTDLVPSPPLLRQTSGFQFLDQRSTTP